MTPLGELVFIIVGIMLFVAGIFILFVPNKKVLETPREMAERVLTGLALTGVSVMVFYFLFFYGA